MFDNPEILGALAEIAVALVGLSITLATAYLTPMVKKRLGVKIEEKHMKALHEAAATWAQTAITDSVANANADFGADFMRYARKSVPDAVEWLAPSLEVADRIARRYIAAYR